MKRLQSQLGRRWKLSAVEHINQSRVVWFFRAKQKIVQPAHFREEALFLGLPCPLSYHLQEELFVGDDLIPNRLERCIVIPIMRMFVGDEIISQPTVKRRKTARTDQRHLIAIQRIVRVFYETIPAPCPVSIS